MKKRDFTSITEQEQQRLAGVKLRVIEGDEIIRAREYLKKWHYLGDINEVGERIWYAVEEADGQWSGVMVFCAGARHLRYRDQWIGWSYEQRRRRLAFVVNQSRCLFFPDRTFPNLGTRALRLACDQISEDWQKKYKHPVLVVETFVDPEQFSGTLYTAGGWEELGMTQGNGRKSREYYVEHHRPKRLFVKELIKNARRNLQAEEIKPELLSVEQKVIPRWTKDVKSIETLANHFKAMSDYRARIGVYPLWSMAVIVAMAHLCGACRGSKAVAGFASKMSQAQLRMAGVRRNEQGKYTSPVQSTIWRFFDQINVQQFNEALSGIETQIRGNAPVKKELVCVDGKEPKHGDGSSILTAICVPSQHHIGSCVVNTKTNEIPVFQNQGPQWNLEGAKISLDALHSQHKTARMIVQDLGSDYYFTVKKNQKKLFSQIEKTFESAEKAVSPPQDTTSPHIRNK